MVQMAKSTKYFEPFGGLNLGTVRVSTENSKDKVILVRCAIFRPATAEFRFNLKEGNYVIFRLVTAAPTITPLCSASQPLNRG